MSVNNMSSSSIEKLREAANEFRRGETAIGNIHLSEMVDVLMKELNRISDQNTFEIVIPILNSLIESQKSMDYVWTADLLEYAVPQLLNSRNDSA